jgi:nicotinamidase-related amidase
MMNTSDQSLSFDLSRTALVMIEFQREWLSSDGKLGDMMKDHNQFEQAIDGGRRVLQTARQAHLTVAHVGYTFSPDYTELANPEIGMEAAIVQLGTFVGRGAEFADDFAPQRGEFVASGRIGVSAFAGSNLDAFLRRKGIDTLLLAGFALQACVESTARNAKDLGYKVYLVEDAVSAFTTAQRNYILEQVIWMFGQTTSTTQIAQALSVS